MFGDSKDRFDILAAESLDDPMANPEMDKMMQVMNRSQTDNFCYCLCLVIPLMNKKLQYDSGDETGSDAKGDIGVDDDQDKSGNDEDEIDDEKE